VTVEENRKEILYQDNMDIVDIAQEEMKNTSIWDQIAEEDKKY